MSTAELKINLINKIRRSKDTHIIEEIQKLIDFELNKDVFQLSDEQKRRIIEAQKDEILTEEQAYKEIEKWLQEK